MGSFSRPVSSVNDGRLDEGIHVGVVSFHCIVCILLLQLSVCLSVCLKERKRKRKEKTILSVCLSERKEEKKERKDDIICLSVSCLPIQTKEC